LKGTGKRKECFFPQETSNLEKSVLAWNEKGSGGKRNTASRKKRIKGKKGEFELAPSRGKIRSSIKGIILRSRLLKDNDKNK